MAVRRSLGAGLLAGALAAAAAVASTGAAPAAEGAKRVGLAGRLLVARPDLKDPRFVRTVIYLVRHDAHGAMGLIVNRPFREVPITLLLTRLGLDPEGAAGSIRLHYGGPVEPGRVFVLHTADYEGEGTEVIAGGIALSSGPGILRALGAGKGPRKVLLLLSYSGWAPGQLEREIQAGGWVTAPADPTLIFDDDETKWERATARRGVDL